MHKKHLPFVAIAGAVVAIIAAILITLKPASDHGDKLSVVASAGFWGDIASQIGGDHVTVTSVMGDNENDPHHHEPGAKDTSDITRADIVIRNGLGYDDFIQKALDTAPNNTRIIVDVADVLGFGSGSNPHLWYHIPKISQAAAAFEAAMSKKDPEHSADYKNNLVAFISSLQPLTTRLEAIRAEHALSPVAYTERVPEYLLQAANLLVVSPASYAAAIEEGNEPSPFDQATMRSLITDRQINVLLYNSQTESESTRQLRDLAAQYNIPVVGVSETPPHGTSYQTWQTGILDSLLTGLKN